MRLKLAEFMYQDINLLLLDEPTNHLDIESREVLEDALLDFEGTIVAISHDRYFLNKIFNRILWLENQAFPSYEGNFDWAVEKRAERLLTQEAKTIPIKPLPTKKVEKPKPEICLETEILKLETKINLIKAQMEDLEDWNEYTERLDQQRILEEQYEELLREWLG